MSGSSSVLGSSSSITVSQETRDRAARARETIESYYADLVRLRAERAERMDRINLIINQESLSENEKLKESQSIKLFQVFAICMTALIKIMNR